MNYNYTVSLINYTTSTKKKVASEVVIRGWDIWEVNLLLLLIFAIIGNTLNILVMRSKRMRNTNTSLFLTSLAIADICVLTLKFLVNMQKLYKIPIYSLCKLVITVPDIAALVSYWLIITTTAERSIAVWYPLKVSIIFSRKRCYIIIFMLITIFTLMSSTQAICLKAEPTSPYYCGIKGQMNGTCKFYISTVYPWIKSAIMSWVPSILGIILNTLIIISLTKASKQRRNILSATINNRREVDCRSVLPESTSTTSFLNLPAGQKKINSNGKKCSYEVVASDNEKYSTKAIDSNRINQNKKRKSEFLRKLSAIVNPSNSKERQITIMLCTISITFVVLTLPYTIYELLRKLNPSSPTFKNRLAHRIVLFFLDCLHATNFILYCLTGKKFRDELINIFRCFNSKKNVIENRKLSTVVTNVVNN